MRVRKRVSETVIRDSDPAVEREDLLIEAQPFLKVLAAIITRLNSGNQIESSDTTEDEAQSEG